MRAEHHSIGSLPGVGGCYILWLRLERDTHLVIGRLGDAALPAGWYGYVGSGRGSGGVRGRMAHHLRWSNRPHWHIDYLRRITLPAAVWFACGAEADEQRWVSGLRQLPGACCPVPGFGASDSPLISHLLHFGRQPGRAACQAVCGVRLRVVSLTTNPRAASQAETASRSPRNTIRSALRRS